MRQPGWGAGHADAHVAQLNQTRQLPGSGEATVGDRGPAVPVCPDAGLALPRTRAGEEPEAWCRADAGQHGFLSIAAHAYADALSVELRVDGVEVIADPGTYCYHGEPSWRAYFRGTRSRTALELAGADQSTSSGPFLWTRHAGSSLLGVDDYCDRVTWTAQHDGYTVLDPPAPRVRTVELDRRRRELRIVDRVDGSRRARLAAGLATGPDVELSLVGSTAELKWPGPDGTAAITLDPGLTWSGHRGEDGPPLGWYSPEFDRKVPSWVLAGTERVAAGRNVCTPVHLNQDRVG